MRAVQVTGYGLTRENLQVNIVPKTQVKPGHLLVRVKAAALNPVDYMMATGHFKFLPLPFTLGCDMAGVVEAVGPGVTGFRAGDEVCGLTGTWKDSGTLAEYCLIPQELAIRKPENLSFEEAATLGDGLITALVGIFKAHNLRLPSKGVASSLLPEPQSCLVWGASGSVGSYAVQLAKAAGFVVIGVCSPHNFGSVRQLGAAHVVDRAAPDAVEQIKRYSEGKLRLAVDAVGSKETTEKCCASLPGDTPGVTYSTVLPAVAPIPTPIHYYEIFVPKDLEDSLAYLGEATKELSNLLAAGLLKPNIPEKISSSLDATNVLKGLQALEKKAVSGKKLVVVVD